MTASLGRGTLSRLETMSIKCSSDTERGCTSMVEYEKEVEGAADEWAETTQKCRCEWK
uniref:Uncharacterized protein n=1 Tax=Peronospora matthiolae TaxID=2874970 RepID=A0AAV1T0Z5_9STRA